MVNPFLLPLLPASTTWILSPSCSVEFMLMGTLPYACKSRSILTLIVNPVLPLRDMNFFYGFLHGLFFATPATTFMIQFRKALCHPAARHRSCRQRSRRNCASPVWNWQDRNLFHFYPSKARHEHQGYAGADLGAHSRACTADSEGRCRTG